MHPSENVDSLPLHQCFRAVSVNGAPLLSCDPLTSLSVPQKFQIVSTGHGGKIMAANELALAEAQRVLRHESAGRLSFDSPFAQSLVYPLRGSATPVMYLRIEAPRAHERALIQLLRLRGVAPHENSAERRRVVLQAEVRLANILGFIREAMELTNGSAQVLSWLRRYELTDTSTKETST